MERTYKLNVTSDTTSIDVQSVNADEVARIAQLAGIVEPMQPSATTTPLPGVPVDHAVQTSTDGSPAINMPTHDDDVEAGLNDIRKNAGLLGPQSAGSSEHAKSVVPTDVESMAEAIRGIRAPHEWHDDDYEHDDGDDYENWDQDDRSEFADPHGHSALRSGTRNQPCPTCGYPNRLTAQDVALGYQCDSCADATERGGEIDFYEPDSDMDETLELDEDVAEYDYGHKKFKDEGEEVDEPEFIWQAAENPQRIKGSFGDNGLIQELYNRLSASYKEFLAEEQRENENGSMSPLSDPTKPSFDKDPLSDETPVDDGSHSPMSTIVRQHAFK